MARRSLPTRAAAACLLPLWGVRVSRAVVRATDEHCSCTRGPPCWEASMQDYRKLLVWQKAHRLALDVYADSAAHLAIRPAWELRSQVHKAAISIPSNLAEGAGRGSQPDFCRF